MAISKVMSQILYYTATSSYSCSINPQIPHQYHKSSQPNVAPGGHGEVEGQSSVPLGLLPIVICTGRNRLQSEVEKAK
jgi:hypothetical protein